MNFPNVISNEKTLLTKTEFLVVKTFYVEVIFTPKLFLTSLI